MFNMLCKEKIPPNLIQDILNEYKEQIKQKVLTELKEDQEQFVEEITQEIDLDELLEAEIQEDMDLELWVKNIQSIYETIDMSETLSLETINEKFQLLVDINAALVAQIRILLQRTNDLEIALKGSQGYGVLGQVAKQIFGETDDETDDENQEPNFFV